MVVVRWIYPIIKVMNILYINGHPYAKSLHAAIQEAYVGGVSDKHEVKVLELGKESFDPILRFGYSKRMPEDPFITKSQELINWADHIVFAFPHWWGDAPALMKGWIERVFTPGVTYSMDGLAINKLLKGKTGDLIVTSRGARSIFWLFGDHGISIFTHNIFAVCGIKKRKVLVLDAIGLIPRIDTQKRREKFLKKVTKSAKSLK